MTEILSKISDQEAVAARERVALGMRLPSSI
jgi:hypothetical protein